jgi:hypothetical protein
MNPSRLILALVGMNAALATALVMQSGRASAASDPEVIRARLFELVDEKGSVRAQLKIEDGGEAVFRMRDAAGEVRVKLGADKDGSGLLLANGKTEPGIHMVARTGETHLTLLDRDARRVLTP